MSSSCGITDNEVRVWRADSGAVYSPKLIAKLRVVRCAEGSLCGDASCVRTARVTPRRRELKDESVHGVKIKPSGNTSQLGLLLCDVVAARLIQARLWYLLYGCCGCVRQMRSGLRSWCHGKAVGVMCTWPHSIVRDTPGSGRMQGVKMYWNVR